MATIEKVAALRHQAMLRLAASIQTLSALFGVDPFELPKGGRDPSFTNATQLDAMATWLESLIRALPSDATATLDVSELDAPVSLPDSAPELSDEALRQVVTVLGIEVADDATREQVIDLLNAEDWSQWEVAAPEFSDDQLRAIGTGLGWGIVADDVPREKLVEIILNTPVEGLAGKSVQHADSSTGSISSASELESQLRAKSKTDVLKQAEDAGMIVKSGTTKEEGISFLTSLTSAAGAPEIQQADDASADDAGTVAAKPESENSTGG